MVPGNLSAGCHCWVTSRAFFRCSREKFSKAMKQYPDLTSKIIKSLVESINDWESQFLRTFEEDEAVCRQYAGVSLL